MKPATSVKCEFCFEGEVGFPPDAISCPVCHGSGFVAHVPRFVPDTREEQRGEK